MGLRANDIPWKPGYPAQICTLTETKTSIYTIQKVSAYPTTFIVHVEGSDNSVFAKLSTFSLAKLLQD